MRTRLGRTALWVGVLAGVFGAWFAGDNLLERGLPPGIVVLGLVFGSLNALVAMGLVLIYKANRVVNFAQAELGAVAAILAIEFVVVLRWNYWLSCLAGLGIALVLGALIDIGIVRRFSRAPRLILSVATIGLAQILGGFAFLIPLWFADKAQAGGFEVPLGMRLSVYPVIFNSAHVLTMITVPVAALALAVFLRFTDYGVAIRAAAENGDRANLLGIPVRRLSTIVWSIAALMSAIAVILRTQVLGFSSVGSVSGGGFTLLLYSLAPAVLGRMESLPVTALAALAMSIVKELFVWTYPNSDFADAFILPVILLALLTQRGKFSRAAETGIQTFRSIKEVRPIPEELRDLREVRWSLGFLKLSLLAAALAFPLYARPSQEQLMGLVFIYAMVAVSLVILTGWAGQISLGHFALVGFGGATAGVLVGRHGWDLFLALPAAALVGGAVSLVIGLPALRISGLYLAVTTVAFAVSSATFFLEERHFPWFIEERLTRPVLWERFPIRLDWQMYYLCFAGLVVAYYAARNLRRTRTGRALIAARDNESASQAYGGYTVRLKLSAFVISGAMAGVAGALYVLHQNGLKTDAFAPQVSLRVFSMVVIGGLGSLPGAVLGAVYVRGAEFFLPAGWTLLASGVGILVLLMVQPGGLGEMLYKARDSWLRYVANHHRLVVPSLVADIRVQAEEAPIAIEAALGGLVAEPDLVPLPVGAGGAPPLSHDGHIALPVGTGVGSTAFVDDSEIEEALPRRRRRTRRIESPAPVGAGPK